jgi:DNA-directed RNA polymerase specialized sigma24 family protein
MSPLPLRRYRAERLLRQEFGALRADVLAVVRARLRARGVRMDAADLEACYAAAWQGLYAVLLAGREVANPAGWLTVVTYRRAVDEHRARVRSPAQPAPVDDRDLDASTLDPDLAAALDDRTRLRQLFEALRGRLTARECEAASLCYLQGLSRAQAAERMGIGEATMIKLMDGRGPTRPGVAGKVGELLYTLRGGGWCEQQASLMRGFAFGILDPQGERYRLARLHQRECPACRAYILSLRGLAAVLPPLALPWGLGAAVGASAGAGLGAGAGAGAGAGSGAGVGAGSGAGAGVAGGSGTGVAGSSGAGAGVGTGASALSASGAAGVGGAAGGGWLLAGGSVGAKLAVSCLLALSVGCVALTVAPHHSAVHHRDRRGSAPAAARVYSAALPWSASVGIAVGPATAGGPPPAVSRHSPRSVAAAGQTSARRAQREFGLEQTSTGVTDAGTAGAEGSAQPAPGAHSASVHAPPPAGPLAAATAARAQAPSRAEREFGPG